MISEKDRELLKTYKQNCELLITMISRDRMKVVFFGRTSNGKSTAINAMLGEVLYLFLDVQCLLHRKLKNFLCYFNRKYCQLELDTLLTAFCK